MVKSYKNIQQFSALNIDAMFFNLATNNLSHAINNENIVHETKTELASIKWLDDYKAWNLGDEIDVCFTDDEIAYVEELEERHNSAFSIFLQSIAATHIFCAAALEAYINKKSAIFLNGKLLDNFDKLSLEGKWLFLPNLFSQTSFNPGEQPFQGFSHLIKIRNKLVHYKEIKVPYSYNEKSTKLYDQLGLSLKDANNSLEATKGMISKLAEIQKTPSPAWINTTPSSYLKLIMTWETENEKGGKSTVDS